MTYFPSPATQDQYVAMCDRMSKSNFVPAAFRGRPTDIYVAAMWGAQLGLAPIVAVQNIAIINGKPSIFGDLAKAICYRSGLMTGCVETVEGEGDSMTAVCTVTRKGDSDKHTFRFSVADAKKARLWGKPGPWTQYPKRMLQLRARGFALRDVFPDVLSGLITSEEAADYSVEPAPDATKTAATPSPEPAPATSAPTHPEDTLPVQDAEYADAPTEPEAAGPDPDVEPQESPIERRVHQIHNLRELVAFYKTLTPAEQSDWKPLFSKMKVFLKSVAADEAANGSSK